LTITSQQQENQLTHWVEQASHSNHVLWHNFAEGLIQNEQAVRAALRFFWSNGPTEGHVKRLKYVKRLMYGRANDNLRKRVFWQGKLAFT
jgi:transposase